MPLKSTVWIYRGLLVCCIIYLTGCGWFGGKDNTSVPTPLTSFTAVWEPQQRWADYSGSQTEASYLKLWPAIYQDQVFTASPDGRVTAFQAQTGEQRWYQNTRLAITGGLGIGENLLLLGSKKGDLLALSLNEGKVQWQTQLSSEILSPPRILQGVIVICTGDGKVVGLEARSAKRLWLYEYTVPVLSLRGHSSPVLSNGMAIIGLANGKLVALQLQSGKVLWELEVAVPRGRSELERMVDIDADPVIQGNTVYAVSYQGRLVAVDIGSGRVLWDRTLSSYTGLSVDADNVYVADAQSQIWAFNRFSGASLWKQTKLQARDVTAPTIIDGYVVLGDKEGFVHWLRRDDGQFAARYATGKAPIFVPPLAIGSQSNDSKTHSIKGPPVLIATSRGGTLLLQ